MDEFREQPSSQIEARKLSSLVERYKGSLGTYEVIQVADAGFLLQSKRQLPMAGNDWFFFDYDDTLKGTTEVKNRRFDLYKDHVKKLGIEASDEVLVKIMDETDRFSRWEDIHVKGNSYHANAHMSALNYTTNALMDASNRKRLGENIDIEDVAANLTQTLDRIKNQSRGEGTTESEDPFYFRSHDKKLILRSKIPWSKEIEEIFTETMINPPDYTETLRAATDLGHPSDSIHRTNIGVFTSGEFYYQLLKVFELIKHNPDLPITQIWLTKVPKGKFIEELIRTKATQKTELQYVPSVLEEDAFESISPGSGYPLGETPHVITIVDDNPKELDSIFSSAKSLRNETGASFVGVRSRRADTREELTGWNIKTPYGEVDFRSKRLTSKEVLTILQINRYLALKSQYGTDNSRTKSVAEDLHRLGIDEKDLIVKT